MKRVLICACAVMLLASVAVPAFATHEPIQTLHGTIYGGANQVQLGLDSSGTATAAWIEQGGAYVATRPADGFFGVAQQITPNYVNGLAFDEASNGVAAVAISGAFNEGMLLVSVRDSASGEFGPIQTLVDTSGTTAFDVRVAVSETGRVVVVWATPTSQVMAAISEDGTSFSAPVTIDTSGNSPTPRVDADASGNALLVYDWTGGSVDEIRVAAAPAGAGFGAPQTIETLAQGPGTPDVAVNSSGAAVVAWADFTDTTNSCGANCTSRDVMEARYGTVAGTFGPKQELTDPADPHAAGDHEVAIDDSGKAAVLMDLTLAGPTYGMYASVSDATGAFVQRQFQAVSPFERAFGPGIARRSFEIAAGAGEFTAFWINDQDQDGINEAWQATTSGSVFGAAHQTSPDSAEDADQAHGARNENGQVVEGWQLFIPDDNTRIQVAPVATGDQPIIGTSGDDDLSGTGGDDVAHMGDGDDIFMADTGNDAVFGEDGNDNLNGQGGSDTVDGGAGNDSTLGGGGNDTLLGGGGNDKVKGGGGDDVLKGGGGKDVLDAGGPGEVLNGGSGKDTCFKYSKKDKLKSCEIVKKKRAH